jgi:hypothetical protein
MRFNYKEKYIPREGDERMINKFLLFPKTLPCKEGKKLYQTRVWERVNIKQIYVCIHHYDRLNEYYWSDICWGD